ncbi:hypothetical protein KMW28_23430 [Flammeovirga yaeyamensis]|uniref:Lipoprotein n=1 Tax=Flammeovirga yaeyamensis TaxID=367791 RepID=A0AAX1NF17_9BACT|nr:hypothetical protein [Flammeovirga yaeyamensis]MBB3696676.1 hypothetical protein [Flammeovirga yaeyamensis]NMF33349.1 hypothetical protein [Flammeovirga yaeyamensis]QWG05375.1 hypothetical protein KMW28_23430 [Flammeovirga yaeyamensis]
MKTTSTYIFYILFSILLSSCDYGENLYIRNYESDTLNVQLNYSFRMEHKNFIVSDELLSLKEIKDHSLYAQKLQYEYDSLDRKLKFKLLPKSTTLIPISTIGYFENIVLEPNDTLWLRHSNNIPIELISKKGMRNLVFDIKMDVLRDYINNTKN